MPRRPLNAADLLTLLDHINLQRANGKLPSEAAEAQQQYLLQRIAVLTEALASDAGSSVTTRVAERLMLADLTLVTAQFRAQSAELGSSIAAVVERLAAAVNRAD